MDPALDEHVAIAADAAPDQGALTRAAELVAHAAQRLEEQDERLERLHGLVECLVEVGPPLAVVEESIVRAWSPALESLTDVRRSSAVGARLGRVLPTLQPTGEREWRWRPHEGSEWLVAVRPGGPQLDVLCWVRHLDAPAVEPVDRSA